MTKSLTTKEKQKIEQEAKALSLYLCTKIKENNPFFKMPNLTKWDTEMERMLKYDNITFDQAKALIFWCQQNSFWQSNILSAAKFRKQIPQLYANMKRENAVQQHHFIPSF